MNFERFRIVRLPSYSRNCQTLGVHRQSRGFTCFLLQIAPAPYIVLDMAGVTHIGSSGIGKILLFYKNLAIKNSRLEVCGLSPMLYELFHELKLDSLFTISKR